MLSPNEPGGLTSRAKTMGMDYDFAKRIQEAKGYSEIRDDFEKFVDKRYQEIGNNLKQSANDYSESWKPCVKEFSDVITDITQHNWFYTSYTCIVSAFHGGISNWYGNTIMRHYGENPVKQRYITAFEIVLSHIFHISRTYFDETEAPDQIIWAISEVTANIILDDPRLLKLWGDDYAPSVIGYPQLVELEYRLRNVFKNNTDFKNYLQTAVQLAKEMDFNRTAALEKSASFWLLTSIPTDFNEQLTPVAIGRNIIIDNALSVDLVEPLNFQGKGWWTFTDKVWTGKGEY
jgi:hypothetical protein